MRLFALLSAAVLCAVSALGQAVDYRALNTNDFTTNIPSRGFVGINTNTHPTAPQITNTVNALSSQFWATDAVASATITQKYSGAVIISPATGNGTATIALGKVANPHSALGGPSIFTYSAGNADALSFQGGAGGINILDAAHRSGDNSAGLVLWSDVYGAVEHHLEIRDDNTAGNGNGGFADVIGTLVNKERRSVGGPSSAHFPFVSGSGANLSELPMSGYQIWKNQPLPQMILSTGGGTSGGSNNIVSCTEGNITNNMIQTFKTTGLITMFSNAAIRTVIQTDTGWMAGGRDANNRMTWDTDRFPDGIPFVTTYCHTNNFEFWIDACYCTRPLRYAGTATWWDVNPNTGTLYQYPLDSTNGNSAIQPICTPETIHRDVNSFYSWNVDGVMFHDQDASIALLHGYQQTYLRQVADAITWPTINFGGQDTYWAQNYAKPHALGLTMLVLPPWSSEVADCSNNLLLDTGQQSTEPQGTSVGVCFVMSELRLAIPSLLRFPNASTHPIIHFQDTSTAIQTAYNYNDWQSIAAVSAMFNASPQIVYPVYCATNSGFSNAWINAGLDKVWQDPLQNWPRCVSTSTATNFGATNSVWSKQISDGSTIVCFVNEATTSTNLTVDWAHLGFNSNTIYSSSEIFTNRDYGLQTNAITVTVPASSALLWRLVPYYFAGFINGHTNRVAIFTPTTNTVGDSYVQQTATNQWEYGKRPDGVSTSTNSWTNLYFHEFTSTNNAKGLEISTGPGDGARIRQYRGSGNTDVMGGLILNDAWNINGVGTVPAGGHNGDLFPTADNALWIGSTSLRVKQGFSGPGGWTTSDAANWSAAPQYASGTYGFLITTGGIEIQKLGVAYIAQFQRSAVDGNFGLNMGNVSYLAGCSAGVGAGTDALWDTFMRVGNEAHTWMFQTNNASANIPPPATLEGAEGSGTDHHGGDIILLGGRSTGLGTNGAVRIQTVQPAASTSSALNVTTNERAYFASAATVVVTNSATGICTITLPTTLKHLGVQVFATTTITDGTDLASVSETFIWTAVNKAGTVTTHVSSPAQTDTISSGGSAGVTTTWTATVSSQTITLKVNAVTTGIASTTSKTEWQFYLNNNDRCVLTPL